MKEASQVLDTPEDMSLENLEKRHIDKVLRRLDWNKSQASKALGISRATLRAKIKRYSIQAN
ncbi:MAG: hypothetical protein A2169_05950 [Deltaproteobacteria bacterium RBG_13_47_9]|nr:MAG: hypothetical protein A2169_05950 [Deltaproteobacteria bacterium RBG_13_47_9]